MTIRQKKLLFLAAAALVLVCATFLWFVSQPPALRLTFLYATNSPPLGTVGVFGLENNLNEPVGASAGFYQREGADGIESRVGDRGANLGGIRRFPPGGSNTFQVWIPTNGGPYRLVLYCLPDSTVTLAHANGGRVRFVTLLSRLHVPKKWLARCAGTQFAISQLFQVSPPIKATATNNAPAVPPDNADTSRESLRR